MRLDEATQHAEVPNDLNRNSRSGRNRMKEECSYRGRSPISRAGWGEVSRPRAAKASAVAQAIVVAENELS